MALNTLTATIPAGKAISTAVDCSGSARIVRLIMPPAWTSAPLTFCMSPDNVIYHDLYHTPAGSLAPYEVKIPTVTPDQVVAFPPGTGAAVAWFKIRSGDHTTPVNQAADRLFQVVVEVIDAVESGGEGAQGPTGPAGVQGDVGPTGPVGTAGAMGAQGVGGPTGPRGATGPAGVAAGGVVDGSEAAPGQIGEVIKGSNAAGLALTTNTPTNLITISLTPGDWNVGSITTFTPVSTGPNGLASGITLTSGTLPTDPEITSGVGILNQLWASSMPSGKVQNIPTSLVRVNTAVTKNVYLVVMASFGGGSVTATGYMSARRIR
jgi:hypothetical protein